MQRNKVAFVDVQAVADVMVVTGFYPQPTREHLLQHRELDQIVRKPKEHVVAAQDLKPLQFSLANFEDGLRVTRNIRISGLSVLMRQISSWVPNLEDNLTRIGIHTQRLVSVVKLVDAEMPTETITIGAVKAHGGARMLRKRAVEVT